MKHVDFLDLVTKHRSVRKFKRDSIPEESLISIIDAGLKASSSGNMQSWCVIASTDAEIRRELFKAHYEQEMILEAPCVLTFCADFNRTRKWIDLSKADQSFDDLLGFLTGTIDAAIAAQNVVLGAESMGFGICYMGSTLWQMDKIGEILKLPKFVVPITSLVIGVPNEEPSVRGRLPLKAVFHREKYEERSDKEILDIYADRERVDCERFSKDPEILKLKDEHNISSVAGMYTAPFKYSKSLHQEVTKRIMDYLKTQGFWE